MLGVVLRLISVTAAPFLAQARPFKTKNEKNAAKKRGLLLTPTRNFSSSRSVGRLNKRCHRNQNLLHQLCACKSRCHRGRARASLRNTSTTSTRPRPLWLWFLSMRASTGHGRPACMRILGYARHCVAARRRVRPKTIQKPPCFYHAFSPSCLLFVVTPAKVSTQARYVDPCRTFWVQQPLFTMPSPEEMFEPYEASATGRRPYRHLDPARSPFPLNRRVDPRFKKVPHPRLSDDARDLSALRLR